MVLQYKVILQYIERNQSTLFYLQYPELNSLIMRRFTDPGDVELALNLVKQVNIFKSHLCEGAFSIFK